MAKHYSLALAIIDLEKIFIKVPHTQLMEVLLCKCSLDPSIVEIVCCMYHDIAGQVVGDSSTFGMTSGGKTGLSCFTPLFLYIF